MGIVAEGEFETRNGDAGSDAGREYWREASKSTDSGLQRVDRNRCMAAVDKFIANSRHPSLNFERLGSGPRQNHCSIRASQELRVILAVDHFDVPRRVALLNMGHHDPMYEWALRQGYHTDLDAFGVVDWDSRDPSEGGSPAIPTADFEEWTLFLPEQQRRLVQRRYPKGVGRIRGAAGTGKTVVALHRAAFLARQYPGERILVTTFSRSLCNHMKAVFGRFPDPPGNVEFMNVDKLAYQLDRRRLYPSAVNAAFEAAYRATIPRDRMAQLDREYMKDEIRYVIKGRDARKEEYLDTGSFERLGRKRGFKRPDREISWGLREAWDREMKERGTVSFEDRLMSARDLAWQRPKPVYRAAIVDEAQDMTLVGMQLVRALVVGRPEDNLPQDGLLVLDDAAQRIYPGGFRPAWAKLNYSGNSDRLDVNYRNTKRIFEAARAVRGELIVSKDANDDGTVEPDRFEGGEGRRPVVIIARNGESVAIRDRILTLVDKEGFKHEEIGVMTRRNEDVDRLLEWMDRNSVPCVNLKDLKKDVSLGSGVRIGTFDRAKGMEFRAVFIPRLGKSLFPINEKKDGPEQLAISVSEGEAMPASEEEMEQRQLNIDRLYVAMTRAMEMLYLIADEQPCPEIEGARNHFADEREEPLAPVTSARASMRAVRFESSRQRALDAG